jgi:hypothetical protein
MPRGRLTRAALLALLPVALLAAGGARAALVIVNDIVLHADGSFQPQKLPRQKFAPIHFQGYFDIHSKSGGKPVPLEEAVIDFDRDGRLSSGGLPVCPPEAVATATTAQARQACPNAIVGSGRVEAIVDVPGGSVPVSAPLTIFNGPPEGGHPTVILHSHTTFPETETLAIRVPIELRRGEFRYRARLQIPPIAEGRGAITRVEVRVGRSFRAGGKQRSYVSAHCSDGILRTHGRFTFSDGTIVDGSVEKACVAR